MVASSQASATTKNGNPHSFQCGDVRVQVDVNNAAAKYGIDASKFQCTTPKLQSAPKNKRQSSWWNWSCMAPNLSTVLEEDEGRGVSSNVSVRNASVRLPAGADEQSTLTGREDLIVEGRVLVDEPASALPDESRQESTAAQTSQNSEKKIENSPQTDSSPANSIAEGSNASKEKPAKLPPQQIVVAAPNTPQRSTDLLDDGCALVENAICGVVDTPQPRITINQIRPRPKLLAPPPPVATIPQDSKSSTPTQQAKGGISQTDDNMSVSSKRSKSSKLSKEAGAGNDEKSVSSKRSQNSKQSHEAIAGDTDSVSSKSSAKSRTSIASRISKVSSRSSNILNRISHSWGSEKSEKKEVTKQDAPQPDSESQSVIKESAARDDTSNKSSHAKEEERQDCDSETSVHAASRRRERKKNASSAPANSNGPIDMILSSRPPRSPALKRNSRSTSFRSHDPRSYVEKTPHRGARRSSPMIVFQEQKHKWVVANQYGPPDGKNQTIVTVHVFDARQRVLVSNCHEVSIQIHGDVMDSLIVENSSKINVIFGSITNDCQVIDCRKVDLQGTGTCSLYSLEYTSGARIWLSKESAETAGVTTNQCTKCLVSVPRNEFPGDKSRHEMALPEKVLHKISDGKSVSSAVPY